MTKETQVPAVYVQVRYSSTRLPGKVMMEINGMTLIERLFDRLSFFLNLPIVFLTSIDPSDDCIEEHCQNKEIPIFRGNLNNVLSRFIDAGETLGHRAFFRVTGDNPFVDAKAMAEKWQEFMAFDYVDNIHSEGNVIGTGFEFVKLDALKAIPFPVVAYDQEHVTTYIRSHPNEFNTWRFIPQQNKKAEEVFLTCDHLEDFNLIEKMYEEFNFSNYVEIEDILSFLDMHQHLLSMNKNLHIKPSY